jgi:hypothetical protein
MTIHLNDFKKELKITPSEVKNYKLKQTDQTVTVNNKEYKLYSHVPNDNKKYFLVVTKNGKTYKVNSEILDPGVEDKFYDLYVRELDQLSVSLYVTHQFNLTDGQIKSIVEAIKNNEPTVLRLKKESFQNGNIQLPLTKNESNKFLDNKAFYYSFNKSKIKLMKIEQKDGAFIPLILGGLAALAGLTTGATSIAKTILDKKANDERLNEENRHNLEMEKVGEGCSNKVVESQGLFLNPYKYDGNGIKDFVNNSKLDNTGKKSLRCILKNLRNNFNVERQGNGLYLSPIL